MGSPSSNESKKIQQSALFAFRRWNPFGGTELWSALGLERRLRQIDRKPETITINRKLWSKAPGAELPVHS